MPYPMQCALCSIVWHRENADYPPLPDAPHDHTKADWDAYIAANSLDPNYPTPIWLKIAGQEYPPLPDWDSSILGPPPPGLPPPSAQSATPDTSPRRGRRHLPLAKEPPQFLEPKK